MVMRKIFLLTGWVSLMSFRGVVPSALGVSIAALYTPKPNQFASEIFDQWLKTLNPSEVKITPITNNK
jgi:hypothetical protein